jgi:hypothetical protein
MTFRGPQTLSDRPEGLRQPKFSHVISPWREAGTSAAADRTQAYGGLGRYPFQRRCSIVKQEEDGMLNASQNEAANSGTIDPDAPDGVYLDDLAEGVVLEVETRGHRYTIVNRTRGEALISGHPRFCPQPTVVVIGGSGLGGCLLKAGFIGLGMRLTFQLPTHRTITTSPIIQIRTSPPLPRP